MMFLVTLICSVLRGWNTVSDAHRVTSLTLLERLRSPADDEAWGRFHTVYGPLIQRWLICRGLQPQDADDVRQEVMRLALDQLSRFEHSGRVGSLRAWLRQVVANRLKTFWRQQNRVLQADGDEYRTLADELEDPDSALSQLWDREYQQAVCQRLMDLAKDEFQTQTVEAFRRVALEGRKATEVAAELGMTPNAVRIAQTRVLARLRVLGAGMLD
jgi:RNA polymerase sigma factor (sigma-70 family)